MADIKVNDGPSQAAFLNKMGIAIERVKNLQPSNLAEAF